MFLVCVALLTGGEPDLTTTAPKAIVASAEKFAKEARNLKVVVNMGGRSSGRAWKSTYLRLDDQNAEFIDFIPGPLAGNIYGRLNILTREQYSQLNRYTKEPTYLPQFTKPIQSASDYKEALATLVGDYLVVPYAVSGRLAFADIFQPPYRITSAAESGRGDDKIVTLAVKRDGEDQGFVEGTFSFRPARDWVCFKQSDVRHRLANSESISHWTLDYQEWPCGLYFPTKIVVETQEVGKPERKPFYTATIESVERDVLTGEEFKLSTYGVP